MFKLIFIIFFVVGSLLANDVKNNERDLSMQDYKNLNSNSEANINTQDIAYDMNNQDTNGEANDTSKVLDILNNRPKTQYYSLIYKDHRAVALDSNQKKFLEKITELMNKFPAKSIALISYSKGNKTPKEDINIAKKRNQYIIDYLIKNGIDETRISKKASSGIIAKQNVELYANSNIIEIMILEKVNLKTDKKEVK